MRKTMIAMALGALVAGPILASASGADAASCRSRKTTGTVIGGVGGALVGNSISHGGGAILGGLGGAVLGNQVAKSGCKRVVYRTATRTRYAAPPQSQPVRKVYYDQYGNVVGSAPAR